MTLTTPTPTTTQPTSDLDQYLRLIAGPDPDGRLLNLRFRLRGGGMGQEFIPAASLPLAGAIIRRLTPVTDVYVAIALRDRRAGGRDAVGGCRLAFVDLDAATGLESTAAFERPPTIVVQTSPGRAHCYWQLHPPVTPTELEQANRRLAHHLHGDPASVDAARIARPPQTANYKYRPAQAVRLLACHPDRIYHPAELAADLPDPPSAPPRPRRPPRPRPSRNSIDRALLAIPAEQYVQALTGRQPDRTGKVLCPFHEDRNPSLQLYADGSWYCFGACHAGGTIYDFAARALGSDTKGAAFLELRDRLADRFGVRPGQTCGGAPPGQAETRRM